MNADAPATDLAIEWVDVHSLTPDPTNARKHGARNLDAIADSLTRFGQRRPLVVTPEGVIIAGNATWAAAKRLGWERVAVTRFEGGFNEARAYGIADNRASDLAEWDTDRLLETLGELDDELLNAAGWSDDEVAAMLTPPPPDDETQATPELVTVKFQATPETEAKWRAALTATGWRDDIAAAADLVDIAHTHYLPEGAA